jgi:hypothetical protein
MLSFILHPTSWIFARFSLSPQSYAHVFLSLAISESVLFGENGHASRYWHLPTVKPSHRGVAAPSIIPGLAVE